MVYGVGYEFGSEGCCSCVGIEIPEMGESEVKLNCEGHFEEGEFGVSEG